MLSYESGAKVRLFSEYAKVLPENLLESPHFVVFPKKLLLCGDGSLHALAGFGREVGGEGIGRDDAEVARAAQCGTLSPYEAVLYGLEACGAGNLLECELHGKATSPWVMLMFDT